MRIWKNFNPDTFETLKIATWIIVLFFSFAWLAYQQGYRLNTSHSYPFGVYRLAPFTTNYSVGDLVLFCPPKSEIIQQALDRKYIEYGRCNSKTVPIIKRIAALEYDRVSLDKVISINGQELINTSILTLDKLKRPLKKYSYQGNTHFIMPSNTAFLFSDYAPHYSFDSRYFGIIPIRNIKGTIAPIWINKTSITSTNREWD